MTARINFQNIRKGISMSYDIEKDRTIQEWRITVADNQTAVVSLKCYNGGAPKLQIGMCEIKRPSGELVHGRIKRWSWGGLLELRDAIDQAIDLIDDMAAGKKKQMPPGRTNRELESEKLIEKSDSLETQILMTLINLKAQVERGILPVKAITDAFNKDKPEKNQVTYQRVGRRLAAMGFERARTGNNAAILWNQENIERMIDAYGLRERHERHETHETLAPVA
jgi:hypothetical protein